MRGRDLSYPLGFNVYMNPEMMEVKIGMGKKGVGFSEDVREAIRGT